MISTIHEEEEVQRNRARVTEIQNLVDHLRDEIDSLDLRQQYDWTTTLAYRFDSNVLTASFSFCFLFIRTRELRVLRNVRMRNSCSIIMLHFVTFSVHCYSVMPCSTSFSNNNASSATHGHSFWPLSFRSSLFCEGLTRSMWALRRTEVSVCPCQASEAFAPSLLRPSESISPSLIHKSRFRVQRVISEL